MQRAGGWPRPDSICLATFARYVKSSLTPLAGPTLEALDGKFDHWRPAEALLRDQSKVEGLSQATLVNFEALTRAINATQND